VSFSKKTHSKGVGGGGGMKKARKMSSWPTIRYQFDLLIVSASTIADFKVPFLYQGNVWTIVMLRSFNRPISIHQRPKNIFLLVYRSSNNFLCWTVCISLLDFSPKNLCIGVALFDTFSSITAHLCCPSTSAC
jgi:hypothetical protein